MIRRGRYLLQVMVVGVLVFVSASPSVADTIIFKNGRSMEGVITEETSSKIVLDLGVGSTTIARSRIRQIKRSSVDNNDEVRDQWRKKNFLHAKHVPSGLEKIASTFRDLTYSRSSALRSRKLLAQGEAVDRKLNAEIDEAHDLVAVAAAKIEKINPQEDHKAYRDLIFEANAARSRLTQRQNDLRKSKKSRMSAQEGVSRYVALLQKFEKTFATRRAKYLKAKQDEASTYFFDGVAAKLKTFSGEFSRTVIDVSSSGNSKIVTVLVNGKTSGRFILDTGAALVTMSQAFASRAGIDTSSAVISKMIVADGRSVNGKQVVLKSMHLDDAVATNVRAVVLPSAAGDDIDGLLGMSFLKNFVMNFDASTGRLELGKF